MFKANTDYTDNHPTQIWVVSSAGGEPRRLSDGRFVDHSPAWSPDGRSIAFISDRGPDPDFHLENDVFVADVATGAVRRLTDSRGSEFYPAWSPDGKSIACLATKRDWTTRDSIAEDFHVWVIPAAGGSPRELGDALDRRVESVAWSPDSRSLLFAAQDRGRVLPYRVSSDGGPTRLLFDRDVWMGEPSLDRHAGRIAFAITSPTAPPEVAVLDPAAAAPRVLTHLNDSLLQELPVEAAETVWFTSTGGARVEGWLMKPMGMEASQRYPLVLFVHGGPHGQFGYRFSAEYQMYASRGYVVLYMNPRGSTGYGQAFSDACLGNWGGVDYEDLMTGVDEVVRTRPFVDPNRMVVTGGSYGGFMTNWIVTHTARFRAAVTREGMSNLATDSALSDAWDLEYIEFGPPWEKYDTLMKWSPIRYITRARTPTLIIEGERDHDVTMAEAEQMYQGLKLQKVETQLVVYPREGHGFHEPKHRADAYERMLRWFGEHLTTAATVDQAWK
jgi:dipeptidyl aminopeptidase/acylaminoacyl peptidase